MTASVAIQVAVNVAINYALSTLFAPSYQGPKLADLRAQTSSLGGGKPIIFGNSRIAGMMIWATPYIEHAGSSGGKGGGGGATVTNYTYTQSMAIALGDVPIIGVRKIWANGRLVYNAGDDAPGYLVVEDNTAQTWFTVYPGTETQTPNSFIQAYQDTEVLIDYFLPMPMPVPEMRMKVGPSVLHTGGSDIRNLVQVTPTFSRPVTNPRIDRVTISQTTGLIHVVAGTEAASPVPPAVPSGYFSCAQVTLSPNPLVEITSVVDERPTRWEQVTAYSAGQFVFSSGNLYKCTTGGTSSGSGFVFGSRPTGVLSGTGTGIVDGRTYINDDGTTGHAPSSAIWDCVGVGVNVPILPTPAYRGTPYVVFYDYSLSATGNTTPNFEFEVVEGTNTLDAIVSNVCLRAGLVSGQIDVSQLAGINIDGFTIPNRSTARSMLEPVSSSYFFDAIESDGKIKFVLRGGNLASTIVEADLAAHNNGSQMPDQVSITRIQELELPRVISVQYSNANNSYQVGSKYHRISDTQSLLETSLQLPLSMTDSEAQIIVDKMINSIWNERTSFDFMTGKKYCYLEPTDIVAIEKGDLVFETRMTHKEESKPGIVHWQAVAEDVGIYSNRLNLLLDNIKTPVSFLADPGDVALPLIMDAPGIATVSGYELWIAAGSQNSNWGGCGVFVSTDGLVFSQIGVMTGASVYGTGTVASGSDPDITNTLAIDLTVSGSEIGSYSQSDADNFLSLSYIGGELVSFETATLTGPFKYNLTYLRRGVYRTPIAAHSPGIFALLNDKIFKYAYDEGMIGQTLYFKFPSFNRSGGQGQDIGSVATYAYIIGGSIGVPSSVTGFAVTQSGNVVVFKWNKSVDPVASIAGYDIGYAPQGTTDWALFTLLTEAAKTTEMTNAAVPPGSWTFGIRTRDRSNKFSVLVTQDFIVVSENLNIIDDVEEVGWTGTKVGLVEHYTGVLVPDNVHNADFYVQISPPGAPSLSSVVGGALGGVTYYVKVAYRSEGGETTASAESSIVVLPSHLLQVADPGAVSGAVGWDVYVSTTSGAETQQNVPPLPFGVSWTEPISGLIAGESPGATNTTGWEVFDQWVPDPVSYIEYTSTQLDAAYVESLRAYQTTGAALGVGQTGTPALDTFVEYGNATGVVAPPNGSGGFIPWTIGTAVFRYLKGRISANIVQGELFAITDYTLVIDMAPFVESSGVVNVANGGTVVVFDPPFHLPPNVIPVAISSGLTSASVTGITATQCTLHVWNGSTDAGLGTSATQASFTATGT